MMPLAEISFTGLLLGGIGYAGSLALFFFKKTDWADILLCVAFIVHTVSQISRGWFIGIFTPHALVEGVFFLPWCLAFFTMSLRFTRNDLRLIYRILYLLLLSLTFALLYPKGVVPPSPLSQTVFSSLFFIFEVMGHACFLLAGWFAFWFLRDREETGLSESFLIWGFISYSIAQVTGAIWCYQGWSTLFNWSERHLQSAALWCWYAAYLHMRFLSSVDLKKRAWFSIAGAIFVVLFSYGSHLREINMPRLGG
ncbi:MAG: cytochrome c biogenesis protein CcsA [Thermodesulfovibrionales bacterium]|nr:cytochrome c biogenesis protein CcsA [Thermodesulfovibrionales bacterium]